MGFHIPILSEGKTQAQQQSFSSKNKYIASRGNTEKYS
jgi:hypothetical protein